MSALGIRTKKVTTYGKKKTQIISIHTDLARNDTSKPLLSPSSPFSPTPAPAPAKRPPLQAKPSQDVINIPATPIVAPSYKKGRLPLKSQLAGGSPDSPPSSPEVIIKRVQRKVTRPGRVVVSRTPSPVKPSKTRKDGKVSTGHSPSSAIGSRRKEVFDGVVLPKLKSKLSHNLLDRFAQVTIEDEPFAIPTTPLTSQRSKAAAASSSDSLTALLAACTLSTTHCFDTFLHSSTIVPSPTPRIRKVGEASYSEVFGFGSTEDDQVVVKVIPLLSGTGATEGEKRNLPDCSSAEDVLREIEITKRMSGLQGGGFVQFLGAYVVEGEYPQQLLDKWDEYKWTLGSASVRPGEFDAFQRYALVVLSNSGTDLESFTFDSARGWMQAAGIFWQIADALARAEHWTRFEHRDLHEGQILIHLAPLINETREDYLSASYTGVQSTIIDFGLSRLDLGSGSKSPVACTTLPEEVFEGKGKQWDLYRAMRDRVDDWEGYHPITNVMWLHYIIQYILDSKSLKKPKAQTSSTNTKTARNKARDAKNKEQAEKAFAMLCQVESTLSTSLAASREDGRTRPRPRRGKVDEVKEMGCAGDVMTWAKEMGWLALNY